MFTADKLALYIDQQIITPDQKKQITTDMHNSGGHDQLINEDGLKDILVGGTLTVDQVEKILKTIKRTDQELDLQFEGIWIEMIEQLPPTMREEVCIADAIEAVLTTYVQGYVGQLFAELQNLKFN